MRHRTEYVLREGACRVAENTASPHASPPYILSYVAPILRKGKKKSDSKKGGSASANAPGGGIGAATSAGGPVIVGDMRDALHDNGVNQSSGGCKCVIM